MARGHKDQTPLIVDGKPLGDSVEFELDGKARSLTIVMQPALALEPIRVTLAWALLKQTTGQILAFEEAEQRAAVEAKGGKVPIGLDFKKACAENLIRDGQAEIAAARGLDKPEGEERQTPGFDL